MKKILLTILLTLVFSVVSVSAATIIIQYGDTLYQLAQDNNTTVDALLIDNPYIENPDLIYVGNSLQIPGISLGGAGGVPISDYSTTLTSPISSTATIIPVASIKTIDDTTITTALITPGVYLVIESANSAKKEIVFCTTVSSSTFTGCTRGLAFSGTSNASVAANRKSHGAGVTVELSDVHFLFVSLNAEQIWTRIQTFDVHPTASSTIGAPTTTYQYATKQYVDNVGAGGFTSSNIGDGQTLRANGTSPETVDINTTTAARINSFFIDNDGFFSISTTTGEKIDLFWNVRTNATTTKNLPFTFSDGLTVTGTASTTSLIVGTGNPPIDLSDGDSYQTGNATTTGTVNAGNWCDDEGSCTDEIVPQFAAQAIDSVTCNPSTSSYLACFQTKTLGFQPDEVRLDLFMDCTGDSSADFRSSITFLRSTSTPFGTQWTSTGVSTIDNTAIQGSCTWTGASVSTTVEVISTGFIIKFGASEGGTFAGNAVMQGRFQALKY